MSWCGGGEISGVPGVAWRMRAMYSVTLRAGSCPPSPGLEPCAILISSSSARTRYSAVTPKRPEATCLIVLGLRLPGVRVEAADKFGRVGMQLRAFAETVQAKVGKALCTV